MLRTFNTTSTCVNQNVREMVLVRESLTASVVEQNVLLLQECVYPHIKTNGAITIRESTECPFRVKKGASLCLIYY
jgi:hypothetical protein